MCRTFYALYILCHPLHLALCTPSLVLSETANATILGTTVLALRRSLVLVVVVAVVLPLMLLLRVARYAKGLMHFIAIWCFHISYYYILIKPLSCLRFN